MNDTHLVEDDFGRYNKNGLCEYVRRFTLSNTNNMSVEVITYGATVTSIKVPDRNGRVADVVLGFDNLEGYYSCPFYIGATVGRYANRIAKGRYILNGETYSLPINNPPNHLHGGGKGYDKVLWDSHVEGTCVTLSYSSKDGEEGYPGEVQNQVTYQVTNDNSLVINYKAKSTKPTPINLTNHSYFNLAGHDSSELIYDHTLSIRADSYTPKDEIDIPTGKIAPVKNTLFDFNQTVRLGDRINELFNGYDHNFCICGRGLKLVAQLSHLKSGRKMEVFSTKPGLQLYTSNNFPTDNSLIGKGGQVYKKHCALCLETQFYPNSINEPGFPKSVLYPGEVYEHTTIYKFSVVQ